MPNLEITILGLLVVLTCGSSAYFGWRAVRVLIRPAGSYSEEASFFRRSAWRRLIVSLLLFSAGLLMAATYVSGLDDRVVQIGEDRQKLAIAERAPLAEADRGAVRTYAYLWIGVMVALFAALMLIAADVWLIRRYFLKSSARIKDDRRAMLNRQLARLRAERSGDNGHYDG